MITSTRKGSYLLSLLVIVVVLALCSTGWAQTEGRLMSFMANSYTLNFALDPADVQSYLNTEINPRMNGQAPLTSLGIGLLIIHSRVNLRDDEGAPIGNGEDYAALLFLVVQDPTVPTPPYPPITLLLVESFTSNPAFIQYVADKGLRDPEEPSEIKRTQEIEVEKSETKIKDLFDIRDELGTIVFKTRFVAPEPTFEPEKVESDFLQESQYGLRFSYAPPRLFSMSYSRAVYEPLVADALLYLEIDGLAGSAGDLFNGLDKNDVTRLRFIHQAQVIDEISP